MLVPHTYNYFIIYIIVRMWYKHYSLVHLPHYLVQYQIMHFLFCYLIDYHRFNL